ncbi:MAG: hypothetical protein RL095_2067 [Verrucomicrobiota bacterium]|jgi:phosphoglycerate dehydrogenase-like enzyme
MKRILVTPRSATLKGHPAVERLSHAGFELVIPSPGRQPAEDELLRSLPGCWGYLCGVEPVSAKVIAAAAPQLKVISRNGAGFNSIDAAAAKEFGVKIHTAPGTNARGVAELALAHLLAAARRLPASDRELKAERWTRYQGVELAGRRLGVVGCGAIGKLLCRFAAALDMEVLAYDLYPDAAFAPGPGFRYASLDEVLESSDFLSLHCPIPHGGRPFLDAATFSRMKPGVIVINTARGELIDADAALAALDSGRLAGLTLDAYASEPPSDWRLVKHPNVIATPHTGAFTAESVDRAIEAAVDNLLAEAKVCQGTAR